MRFPIGFRSDSEAIFLFRILSRNLTRILDKIERFLIRFLIVFSSWGNSCNHTTPDGTWAPAAKTDSGTSGTAWARKAAEAQWDTWQCILLSVYRNNTHTSLHRTSKSNVLSGKKYITLSLRSSLQCAASLQTMCRYNGIKCTDFIYTIKSEICELYKDSLQKVKNATLVTTEHGIDHFIRGTWTLRDQCRNVYWMLDFSHHRIVMTHGKIRFPWANPQHLKVWVPRKFWSFELWVVFLKTF
jgi:hypothetical protein